MYQNACKVIKESGGGLTREQDDGRRAAVVLWARAGRTIASGPEQRPRCRARHDGRRTAVPREKRRTPMEIAAAIDRLSAADAGCDGDEMRALEPALVRY